MPVAQDRRLSLTTGELRSLSSRYEAVLEALPDIVVEVDAEGVYSWANRTALEFFGDDVVGRAAHSYCEGDLCAPDAAPLPSNREGNVEYAENWQRRQDGEKRLPAWWRHTLRDADGAVSGALSTAHDITDQRLAERDRRELEEQLAQAQKLEAVGQLAAGIAHDFRNILTTIVGYAELLSLQADIPESAKTRLAAMQEQGQRGAELIRQILDFSRKSIAERMPLDLRAVVDQTADLLKRTIPESISVAVDAGEGEYVVRADATQRQQVITNLAVNARDAMPDGGQMRIGV